MTYTWNSLEPEDYRAYRLARFGEAGRCGKEGVAKAAKQHGVAVRTWYTYEGGSRRPNPGVAGAVARWLNRTARRDRKPRGANVEISLGRPAVEVQPESPADTKSTSLQETGT